LDEGGSVQGGEGRKAGRAWEGTIGVKDDDGWMDGLVVDADGDGDDGDDVMYRWIDGLMDGWVDGWIDRLGDVMCLRCEMCYVR